jgi:dienelactone hydrolase
MERRTHMLVALSLLATATAPCWADDDLTQRIRALDGRVIERGTVARSPVSDMLSRFVAAELRDANRRDRLAWSEVTTKTDWELLRDQRLEALRSSLGRFPEVPANLKIRITRTVKGDGYEVDNLVFESRAGVVVTANLYRPTTAAGRSMPGIVICHSHHRPKHNGARQLMAATWARAGCVVYVPDHIGHGERQQHPFRTAADYEQPFNPSYEDYYSRYDMGIQLHLIGDSLMGWLVWDLWRGVDVLLSQPGVDAKRIIVISEPAGGGDVAAVAAALDQRITGVMVNNFGGPEPENGYPLPRDADEWFPYASSGSWESTRNLRLSARDDFLPWTIVAAIAPRRFIYYHEFYWDREQDPVWKRLQKIYGFYNASDRLAGIAGHGFVVGSSPENTHWTPYSRELLYPTLERWFGITNPKQEFDKLLPEEDLLCLTEAASKQHQPVALNRLCAQLGTQRTLAARQTRESLPIADQRASLRQQWSKLLGDVDVATPSVVKMLDQERLADIAIERIQLETESGIIVPVVLLIPQSQSRRQMVVAVAQGGKQDFLRHRAEQISELLASGASVCLLDVRGTGETDPGDGRGRRSEGTTLSSSELMLGQTLVAARLRDVRQVLRYLRQRDELDAARISLWGESFAPVNAADCNFIVPRGAADRPHQSEPLGGMLALLAALFDDRIESVYVHGGLSGFRDVLESPFCYVPHDAVVPGVLTAGDLCDVAAALAPRRLRLDSLVDGLNRRLAVESVRDSYSPAIQSYARLNAAGHFVTTGDGKATARWLLLERDQTPEN